VRPRWSTRRSQPAGSGPYWSSRALNSRVVPVPALPAAEGVDALGGAEDEAPAGPLAPSDELEAAPPVSSGRDDEAEAGVEAASAEDGDEVEPLAPAAAEDDEAAVRGAVVGWRGAPLMLVVRWTMSLPWTTSWSLERLRSRVNVSSPPRSRSTLLAMGRLMTPRKPWSFFLNFFWSKIWTVRTLESLTSTSNDSFQSA